METTKFGTILVLSSNKLIKTVNFELGNEIWKVNLLTKVFVELLPCKEAALKLWLQLNFLGLSKVDDCCERNGIVNFSSLWKSIFPGHRQILGL